MKKITRILCVMLVVAISSVCFIGCGGSKYDPNNFIEDTNSQKIVKEKITIKMFAPKNSLHVSDWNEMRLFKEMEEETNIHIEWLYGSTENYDNARANAWQSRNKPDAFFLWNTLQEQIKYSKSGAITPLDDLIKSYAPNYKALMDANPEMKDKATLEDNKMYSTVLINTVPRDWTFKQFINKKWIDWAVEDGLLNASDLNSDGLPATTESFKKVLVAFKTMDSTNIPMSSVGMRNTVRSFLMSGFGFVTSGVALNANDNVIFVQNTDNYREYLKYCRELYSEGLIDNSIFTMKKEADLAAKGSKVGSFDGSAAYLIVGENNDKDYVALPPLTSSINSEKMWLDFDNKFDPTGLIVTSNTDYKREIVRWIDRLYSKTMIKTQAFGKEGVEWTWDKREDGTNADGTMETDTWTFNVPVGKGIEQFRGSLTPGVGLGVVAYWDGDFVLKQNDPFTQRVNEQVEVYIEHLKPEFPPVKLTQAENSSLSVINQDLTNYTTEFEQNVITGKIKINDSTWAAHLNTLQELKVNKIIEIYQAAYNRYKDSK